MATAVTNDLLRDLASFEAENGCALSMYIDLDPSSTPTPPDVESKFNAVLAEAERLVGEQPDRNCRMAVAEDISRIRNWWDDELDRDGARGAAIFASAADGFFRTLLLPDAVGDAVQVSRELMLQPLAGRLGRDDGALVVVVSRERGTVYRLDSGRLVEVVDESDDVPGQHDQGGWSQARYQRHIEKIVREHLKNVGSEVEKRVRRGGKLLIVGVAPEELRPNFEGMLGTEAREALAGWATAEAHAGPRELLEVVRPVIDEARARRDQEMLERYAEERGRGARAAAGWQETLDAASDARVEVLLLANGAQRRAWRCPSCGRASADGGRCPLDDAELEERPDAADLAIRQTLLHGGTVLDVGPGALGDAGDIGALLRF